MGARSEPSGEVPELGSRPPDCTTVQDRCRLGRLGLFRCPTSAPGPHLPARTEMRVRRLADDRHQGRRKGSWDECESTHLWAGTRTLAPAPPPAQVMPPTSVLGSKIPGSGQRGRGRQRRSQQRPPSRERGETGGHDGWGTPHGRKLHPFWNASRTRPWVASLTTKARTPAARRKAETLGTRFLTDVTAAASE